MAAEKSAQQIENSADLTSGEPKQLFQFRSSDKCRVREKSSESIFRNKEKSAPPSESKIIRRTERNLFPKSEELAAKITARAASRILQTSCRKPFRQRAILASQKRRENPNGELLSETNLRLVIALRPISLLSCEVTEKIPAVKPSPIKLFNEPSRKIWGNRKPTLFGKQPRRKLCLKTAKCLQY